MKASKRTVVGNLMAIAILALSLTAPASAGNTASGTVLLGVVLVSTVQAEPQPPAQTLQFAVGSGATVQVDSANAGMKGQVREIEVVISPQAGNVAFPANDSVPQSPQAATASVVQTTYVAD